MVKLATTITYRYGAEPGFAFANIPQNAAMARILSRIPGCKRDDARHGWLVPEELCKTLGRMGREKFGWNAVYDEAPPTSIVDGFHPSMRPYQREDAQRAIDLGRAMYAWEMGLGKSIGTIEPIRVTGARRVLIVCPAMVRSVWLDELKRWWPKHLPAYPIFERKEALSFTEKHGHERDWIAIISYHLLKDLRLRDWGDLDFVVLDESHFIKHEGAGWSRHFASVQRRLRRDARRLWLTGTPITIDPIDLYHQCDCLYPGRLGDTRYEFAKAYCGKVPEPNAYSGYAYLGVNRARAEELYGRLGHFVLRRTKDDPDVAPYLPPIQTQTIRIRPRHMSAAEIRDMLADKDVEGALLKLSGEKLDAIVDFVKEDMAQGHTHLCLVAYYHATGKALAERLSKEPGLGGLVTYIDGTLPEKRRTATIDKVRQAKRGILVATMKSINVGINLSTFQPASFVELYSAPGVMSQVLGRFHRMGGLSAFLRFFVLEGSGEELVASRLERRIREHGQVIQKGKLDSSLLGALEDDKDDSPRGYVDRVREAIRRAEAGEDEYL